MTTLYLAGRRGPDRLQKLGDFLSKNRARIAYIQWSVVGVYLVLLLVPVLLPLPDNTATIWSNLTRFAQFVFWGIWWPFVILITAVCGRVWCGFFCPEGFLSEVASRRGLGRAIPHWLRWGGWPTLGFGVTTIYGQLISVYQYPKAAALILGGSTAVAVLIGAVYGRSKRVWCRFLCPVSGVLSIVAKTSVFEFQVDPEIWRLALPSRPGVGSLDCAPMIPIKTMTGNSDCHMCGRCSGFRGAVRLRRRSPSHEIVNVAATQADGWQTFLILFCMSGLAFGAFQWSSSPLLNSVKQLAAEALIDKNQIWPLETTAPWFVLTNYPERSDVLSILDGGLIFAYVLVSGFCVGLAMALATALGSYTLGGWDKQRFYHLAQSLIPVVSCGIFSGLLGLTISQLRMDGLIVPFSDGIRQALLLGAAGYSLILCWRIAGRYSHRLSRRAACVTSMIIAVLPLEIGWIVALS